MKNLKTLITIAISLLASCSIACEVTGPKLIIFNNSDNNFPNHLFVLKDCNSKEKKALYRFLSDFEGSINQRTLNTETGIKFKSVSETEIISLSSLLNSRITKDKSWGFIKSDFTGLNKGFLKVEENESLTVSCSNCNNTGHKNIKLEVRDPINSRLKTFWSKTQLAARTLALFPKDNLPVDNKALTPNQFESRIVYDIRPEQFFTDKNKLVFYKTNRPRSKGEAIRFQDLTPVNLVSIGQPTTVVLRNNNLTLETIAIPGQSGKLGQRIRLKNPRTKKIIIGKVINFNKVEVEL